MEFQNTIYLNDDQDYGFNLITKYTNYKHHQFTVAMHSSQQSFPGLGCNQEHSFQGHLPNWSDRSPAHRDFGCWDGLRNSGLLHLKVLLYSLSPYSKQRGVCQASGAHPASLLLPLTDLRREENHQHAAARWAKLTGCSASCKPTHVGVQKVLLRKRGSISCITK